MNYISISDGIISVEIDAAAATLHSVRKGGVEYLWQGDEKYWRFQDKNLFPYVGRLTDEKYSYKGNQYAMKIHGFCGEMTFSPENLTGTSADFVIADNAYTRGIYPFAFEFRISYSVENGILTKKCSVSNRGEEEMCFGLGSHPGFNVPLGGDGSFDDWYFEFEKASEPVRIGFDQETYRLNDINPPYELEEGRILRLEHSKFDLDAIVLQGMPKTVTLKSDRSEHAVRASFPDMEFLGLWHMPHTDAPYVCIEPWLSLPSHADFIEDLEQQKYIVHLQAGDVYNNTIQFEII